MEPARLGVPRYNGICMLQRLTGEKGRMKTSHHDRHAALPVMRRNVVRPFRGKGAYGYGHQIRLPVQGILTQMLINGVNVMLLWGKRGKNGQCQRLHDGGAVVALRKPGTNQDDPHQTAPFRKEKIEYTKSLLLRARTSITDEFQETRLYYSSTTV
jgi:hypothetical protein